MGRNGGWIKWIVALAIAAYILKVWFGLSGRNTNRRPPRRPPATNVYPEQGPQLPVDGAPPVAPRKGADDYPRGMPVSRPAAPSPSTPTSPAGPAATTRPVTSFIPSGKGKASEDGTPDLFPETGVPGYGRPLPKATPYSPPGYNTKPSNAGAPQGY